MDSTECRLTASKFFPVLILVGILTGFCMTVEASVRQCDVTKASSGNTLMAVKGTYSSATKDQVLTRMNQIRKEAADEQVISGYTYTPIKWSSDMEWIAQLRAAEASVFEDHTRPSGKGCFSIRHNGIGSESEVLAWNYSGMMAAIEQWYSEKSDFVNKTGGVTGHYTAMLYNDYVGLGCFRADGNWFAVAGEFSNKSGLNETKSALSGAVDQIIEVQQSRVVSLTIDCEDTFYIGNTGNINVNLSLSVENAWGNKVTRSYSQNALASFSTSPAGVVQVDGQGSAIRAVGGGQTTITASVGSRKATKAVHVHQFSEWVTTQEPELSEDGMKVRKCLICGLEEKETIPAYGTLGANWKAPKMTKVKVKKTKATLKWKKNKKMQKMAAECEIQIATDSSFRNIVLKQKLPKKKTSFKFPGTGKTRYYARVRYISAVNYSMWSKTKQFKLK